MSVSLKQIYTRTILGSTTFYMECYSYGVDLHVDNMCQQHYMCSEKYQQRAGGE